MQFKGGAQVRSTLVYASSPISLPVVLDSSPVVINSLFRESMSFLICLVLTQVRKEGNGEKMRLNSVAWHIYRQVGSSNGDKIPIGLISDGYYSSLICTQYI